MASILFIGGTGNISSYCVLEALKEGHKVFVLTRGQTTSTRRAVPVGANHVQLDYRDCNALSSWLERYNIDIAIDFLCFNQQDASNAYEVFRNRVKRYIFISSVTVYRRPARLPFTEASPRWEDTDYDYALGKKHSEDFFMDMYETNSFPVTIVRPAHTYDTIVPVSIGHNCFTVPHRYSIGKPVLIAGDGTNLWTLTHSRDFASALVKLVQIDESIGDDYHITSEEWLTWLEITEHLLRAMGLPIEPEKWLNIPICKILELDIPVSNHMSISYLGKAFKGQRMWCDIYNNSKLKRMLPQWKAATPFAEGIKETIDWLHDDPVRQRLNPQLSQFLDTLHL